MRKKSLLLLAALASVASLRADDDKPAPQQPVENLYFNTDEFVYIPQFTFKYGYRYLSGSKTSFRGNNITVSNPNVNAYTEIDSIKSRIYQDGGVSRDQRTTGSGVYASSDGMTNNWAYYYPDQATSTPGYVAFHTYDAKISDTGELNKSGGNTYGFEVACSRDFGKIGRVLVSLGGGIGLNDINQQSITNLKAKVTVLEDLYWLDGKAAPAVTTGSTYTSPKIGTENTYGPNGEVIYTDPPSNTSQQTQSNDLTVLIGQTPSGRNTYTFDGTVKNTFKIKGSFLTMRFGPDFLLPVTAKFRLTMGIGAALAYIGNNYKVDSEFFPDVGNDSSGKPITVSPISETTLGYDKAYTVGYYLEGNMEYWFTERTGLYAGAIFQNSGHFDQKIKTDYAQYSSRVDLSSMSGFRSGMTYRF